MISHGLKEAIKLVEQRDPLLNELSSLKVKLEDLKGVEKEYYDLYNDVSEIDFEDDFSSPEFTRYRRLLQQISKLKKANPGIHDRVFTATNALVKKWKLIRSRMKKAKAAAKEVKRQDRMRQHAAETAVKREVELDAKAKVKAEAELGVA